MPRQLRIDVVGAPGRNRKRNSLGKRCKPSDKAIHDIFVATRQDSEPVLPVPDEPDHVYSGRCRRCGGSS